MANTEAGQDRHILIAVDESENSKRALLYAADFLGGVPGFRATVVKIVPEPAEDYFQSTEEHDSWISEEKKKAEEMLSTYSDILVQSGFRREKVDCLVEVRQCPSVAQCIIEVQKRLKSCTVVVGRRVVSRKEEFLFGSTSSRLLHAKKSCAVWVVE
jgi:nucleotide-binding universal stress UspA family protein